MRLSNLSYYGDNVDFYNEETIPDRMGRGATLRTFMKDGEVRITNGSARISESIEDILGTYIGRRFFCPQYGSKLYRVIFEPNDFIARDLAIEYSKQALGLWEPRIDLQEVTAECEGKVLEVHIEYIEKETGTPGSYVYTIERKVPELT